MYFFQMANSIKCPGNIHPEAGAQFDFTNAIIQGRFVFQKLTSSMKNLLIMASNGDCN